MSEEDRDRRRKFEADVEYEVWRGGGNPDNVDRDRVDDRYYDGADVDAVARQEIERQRPRPSEPEM